LRSGSCQGAEASPSSRCFMCRSLRALRLANAEANGRSKDCAGCRQFHQPRSSLLASSTVTIGFRPARHSASASARSRGGRPLSCSRIRIAIPLCRTPWMFGDAYIATGCMTNAEVDAGSPRTRSRILTRP